MRRHRGGSFVFALTLARKDLAQLQAFKKDVRAAQPITLGSSFSKVTKKSYPRCRIVIVRRRFVQALMHILPFGGLSPDLERYYLRGYFDGDGGWTYRRTQIAFSVRTTTEEWARYLQEILVRNCRVGRTKIGYNTGAYRMGYEGNRQCRRIAEFMYAGEGPVMGRKIRLAEEHLGRFPSAGLVVVG